MDNSNEHLKDPLEELPNELFAHSLSFLPPQSIANTTALSKRWRSTVHSHQSLHREVDLSGFLEAPAILYHLTHLSFLASHSLVKVSLNLGSFFNDWEKGGDRTISTVDTLFEILKQSKASILEFSLRLFYHDDDSIEDRRDQHKPLLFLLLVIKELHSFIFFKSIKIATNLPFTLKANGHGNQFSLTNSFGSEDDDLASGEQASNVMKEVRRLVGVDGGITELSVEGIWGSGQGDVKVVEELRNSSSTIQHLDLYYLGDQVVHSGLWNDVVNCPKLVSLSLRLIRSGEQNQLIGVPVGNQATDLKTIDLNIRKLDVNWDSLASWVSRLEVLKLKLDRRSGQGTGLLSKGINGSIVFNSRETLKQLRLTNVGSGPDLDAEGELSFPNLESIFLEELGGSAFRSFSHLRAPKLREVKIYPFVKTLGGIVEFHASQLVELGLGLDWTDPNINSEPYFKDIILRFESLEGLSIWPFDPKQDTTALGLEESFYPNLRRLDSKELRYMFKKNAPKLDISLDLAKDKLEEEL